MRWLTNIWMITSIAIQLHPISNRLLALTFCQLSRHQTPIVYPPYTGKGGVYEYCIWEFDIPVHIPFTMRYSSLVAQTFLFTFLSTQPLVLAQRHSSDSPNPQDDTNTTTPATSTGMGTPLKTSPTPNSITDGNLTYVKDSGICETTPGVHQVSGYINVSQDTYLVCDVSLFFFWGGGMFNACVDTFVLSGSGSSRQEQIRTRCL